MKRCLVIGALCTLPVVIFFKRDTPPQQLTGTAMGCRWVLEWRDGETKPRELKREVEAVLEHWEQTLSQWRPASDLSRYNRGEPATPDLARVIALADEMKTATDGAFDHHLLEKVHEAGFGPAGTGIDLSSIGKGFAVDRVGERMRRLGVNDFVFALAGEVLAGDGPWPVGIEKPDPSVSESGQTIHLQRRAVATSGNYRQFRQTARGIESHIIDPSTGRPVIRPLSAVTVIAPDCATASAWATALFVLGPDFKETPDDLEVHWQISDP